MSAAASHFAELTRTILVMSLAGSAIALLLFILKPLIKDRLPKMMQYCMWLVVLAALLAPVSKIVVLPKPPVSGPASLTPIYDIVHRNFFVVDEAPGSLGAKPQGVKGANDSGMEPVDTGAGFPYMAAALAVVWLLGVLVFLSFNTASYMIFTRKLRKHAEPASLRETEILNNLSGKGHIPNRRRAQVFRNPLVPTPMLTGVSCPAIMLPDSEYTDAQLISILLHELTHLRRRDIIVKWLSVLAGALHWFNPVVYLARREINSSCELACDESIIRSLNTNGKRNYGDTLIAVVAAHGAAHTAHPAAMSSANFIFAREKEALKERLGSIMKYKRFSAMTVVLSCALLVVVICGAIILGAASRLDNNAEPEYPVNEAGLTYGTMAFVGPNNPEPEYVTGFTTPEPGMPVPGDSVPAEFPSPQPRTTGVLTLYYGERRIYDFTVRPGESVSLSWKLIAPDMETDARPALLWESGNENVFTVDSATGEITAVGHGTAICTATAEYVRMNGTVEYATADCIVRVAGF